MKKSLKIIFTLSIVLNLLFIGLSAGYIYSIKFAQKPWEKVKGELSNNTREIIKSSFSGGRKDIIPIIRDIRKKKNEMKKIMTAKEFDIQAYNDLANEVQKLEIDFTKRKYKRIGNILSRLPQEERLKMADHLVARLFGKKMGRGDKNRMKGDRGMVKDNNALRLVK